jgi:hypothetical protein
MARKGQFKKGQVGYWAGKKRTFSAEHRKKLSLTSANRSPETREKLSAAKRGRRPKNLESLLGVNHWNWKGGISNFHKTVRQMKESAQWRSDVFQRDGWTCQTCGARGVYVEAHHIIGFAKIMKEFNITTTKAARACELLWDISNGVTLCRDCHKLTENFNGRAKMR